jgi:hypothetical protein
LPRDEIRTEAQVDYNCALDVGKSDEGILKDLLNDVKKSVNLAVADK